MKTLFNKVPAANIEPPAKTDEKADDISSSDSDNGFKDEVWLQYHGCLLTECDKLLLSTMCKHYYITSFLLLKDYGTHFFQDKELQQLKDRARNR